MQYGMGGGPPPPGPPLPQECDSHASSVPSFLAPTLTRAKAEGRQPASSNSGALARFPTQTKTWGGESYTDVNRVAVKPTGPDWAPWATTVTPPTAVHSHHNEGTRQALFLIVQDGGIYNHARTMGFEYV